MVFQAHNLFPHKTALGNVIEGPVQVQKRALDEAEADARELLAKVGLAGREAAYPALLRVASSNGSASRGPWPEARVVLLDDPTWRSTRSSSARSLP